MKQLNITGYPTENSITVFWKKPIEADKDVNYIVIVDGKQVGETSKTHIMISELEEQTTYKIIVNMMKSKECKEAYMGEIVLTTKKEKERINIVNAPYNAIGDGKTLNTESIQKAFDDCKEGQCVYIPEGIFMTGALRMHSHMELFIDSNGVLQGTSEPDDYLPRIKSRFEGTEMMCYSSLLNLGELDHETGYNCKDVVICGGGTIAGGGRVLAEKTIAREREKLKDYIASLGDEINTYENADTIPGRVRSRLINMSNCQDIRISDMTLKDGASWNVHMIYSDNILTDNCKFYSKGTWNGDGWDPDSSTNCTIFGCEFFTGDDSIAIKSGKNPEGNIINRPTKHICIFDCKCSFGHGIAIGSEMSGGIEDVQIWDCDLQNSSYGIQIKGTKKRGGYVREVHVRDSIVPRILFQSVNYNDDGIGAKTAPVFENCTYTNLIITGCYLSHENEWIDAPAIELCGFEEEGHEIQNIHFKDITLTSSKKHRGQEIIMEYCKNITFENMQVR